MLSFSAQLVDLPAPASLASSAAAAPLSSTPSASALSSPAATAPGSRPQSPSRSDLPVAATATAASSSQLPSAVAAAPIAAPVGRLASKSVTVNPRQLVIRARDTMAITVTFAPGVRVAAFREPFFFMAAAAGPGGYPLGAFSAALPVTEVTGACLGTDVSLELDALTFGSVCEGAAVARPLQIYNNGDVPAVFKWRTKLLGRDFSISPTSGVVAPHSDLSLTVTFAPSQRGADIRVDRVPCDIEGLPAPLLLTLSGDCVVRPPPAGPPLQFACRVRESVTQVITLPKNETDRPITVAPVVTHPYWTGPSVVEVPARSTATCTLTYKPLTMTKEEPAPSPPTTATSEKAEKASAAAAAAAAASSQHHHAASVATVPAASDVDSRLSAQAAAQIGLPAHTGNVFFPMPDGSGLVYTLVGKAAPPSLGGSLVFKATAKKTLNFIVPVANWLPVTQRFDVTWDTKSMPASAVLKVSTGRNALLFIVLSKAVLCYHACRARARWMCRAWARGSTRCPTSHRWSPRSTRRSPSPTLRRESLLLLRFRSKLDHRASPVYWLSTLLYDSVRTPRCPLTTR
jgi:hypothetical protein